MLLNDCETISLFFAGAILSAFEMVFASALILLCGACQSTNPPTSGFSAQLNAKDPAVLVPGDVIRLVFSGAPDLNQSQKIRPDGKITLPLIGEIDTAGETFAAFQQHLQTKYKAQLKNSEVAISLEGSSTRSIAVDELLRAPVKTFRVIVP